MSGLTDLLVQEASLVGQFAAALGEEQEALKAGRADVLDGINQRKSDLVARLNHADALRNTFLKTAGFAETRKGTELWLQAHPRDSAAADAWGLLLQMASEARNLNELNGQLIAMRLQATNQALATLSAQAQTATLYGPDGQAAPGTGSRIIDAA